MVVVCVEMVCLSTACVAILSFINGVDVESMNDLICTLLLPDRCAKLLVERV